MANASRDLNVHSFKEGSAIELNLRKCLHHICEALRLKFLYGNFCHKTNAVKKRHPPVGQRCKRPRKGGKFTWRQTAVVPLHPKGSCVHERSIHGLSLCKRPQYVCSLLRGPLRHSLPLQRDEIEEALVNLQEHCKGPLDVVKDLRLDFMAGSCLQGSGNSLEQRGSSNSNHCKRPSSVRQLLGTEFMCSRSANQSYCLLCRMVSKL